MARFIEKVYDGHKKKSAEKKKVKISAKSFGKGSEIASFLSVEFGVETIFLTDEPCLQKIGFPKAEIFSKEVVKNAQNWILIHL